MRRTSLFIALSLTANAALGVVLWQRTTPPSAPPTSTSTSITANSSHAAALTPAAFSAQWRQLLQSPDDTTALAFLHSSGFPPDIVRSLMSERIRARYQDRFRELDAKQTKTPYWKTGGAWYNFDSDVATRSERRALEREIQDTVRQLLGDDSNSLNPYESDRRSRSYGDLPSDKITQIEAITRDYGELNSQIRDNAKGVILAEDREKLDFLQKERRADLAAVLTSQELEEYDRRNSPSAGEIRGKLRFFDATEAEFLALYQAQRDFDTRYGRDNLSGEKSDLRKAALPQLTERFKAALGTERYAEFELLTDGNYSSTRSSLTQLGLPADSARELVATQRAANKRAEAIRADKSLTPEQQATQLATLEKESVEKVTATIGVQNLADYKKYSGNWLTRLAPPSKTPSTR